jgi:nucleoside-diphosphate-sugar epimerase
LDIVGLKHWGQRLFCNHFSFGSILYNFFGSVMTILVLGGTGFVGRHVTRRLAAAGHTVTVFHRGRTTPDLPASVSRVHGSRDDQAALRDALDAAAPEVVVDAIAYTEAQATQLAALADGRVDRLVALSSGDVYRQYDGLRGASNAPPDPIPLTEDSPLRTSRYPYRGAETDFEYAADYDKILVEERLRGGPVPATILRLPMVYGPGDPQRRVQGALDRVSADDEPVVIGERQARWRTSRGYVENVAAAIVRAVTDDAAAGRTYNLGEPDALPEATWLRRVAAAAGLDVSFEVRPDEQVDGAPPFDWAYDAALDTRRLRTELSFAEPIAHAEALSRTRTGAPTL